MKSFPFVVLIFLMISAAHSKNSLKEKALSAAREFFQLTDQMKEFNGHYLRTSEEYGDTCKIVVDFTRRGHESISVVGEYTPMTTTGDGVFFDETDETFTHFALAKDTFTIEQTIHDSFSTWMKTTIKLSKHETYLDFWLHRSTSVFFVKDSVEKRCVTKPAELKQSNRLKPY